jgi:hypothetical protein
MNSSNCWIQQGEGPLVATAIHDGHRLRNEVAQALALSEDERLREEDPYTGAWTGVAETRIVVHHSRFQVDLNRPRERAVYRRPEDAWGLHLWHDEPEEALIQQSLAEYDAFYAELKRVLSAVRARQPLFVVYDLHSYNHRRDGADAPAADPQANPEVNVGTGNFDRERWAPVVDRFIRDLSGFDFMGRRLDVRENVKFRGGHLSNWIHDNFADSACVLAIEFKKFFMDEWTGRLDGNAHEAIDQALRSTVPGVLEALNEVTRG